MRFAITILLLLIAALGHTQRFDDVVVTPTQITDKIYMLEGAGGNIGVFVGEDGVFVIDSQYAELSERVKAAISELSDDPVKYLVNTHWHGDHTGGNENFGNDNATIIAHENVRERLSNDQIMKAFDREVKAAPEAAWPTLTFKENMTVHINGEDILIFHVHNAHTDGDSFVWFTQSNVLHMGDCFFSGRFPFIDLGSGGSIAGAIKAAEAALMIIDNETKIIPGHGPISNKFDLLKYYTMLSTLHERVADAIEDGQSIDAIKSGNILEGYETGWGDGFINNEKILDTIWTDLSRDDDTEE